MTIPGNPLNPSGGGGIPPIWGRIAGVGTFIAGAGTVRHQQLEGHHYRLSRLHQHQRSLNLGQLNPRQFVAEQALDRFSAKQIETHLQAWGGTWEGVSFANRSSFSVEVTPSSTPFSDPAEYKLRLHQSPDQSPAKLGRRVSATSEGSFPKAEIDVSEALEPTSLLHNSMNSHQPQQWSPSNRGVEVSQGVSDAKGRWETFTYAVPPTPFLQTWVGATVVMLSVFAATWWGSSWLTKRLGGKGDSSGWGNGKQALDEVKRLHVMVESTDGLAQLSTASDSTLKVLTAFHNKTITLDAAISLLKDFHSRTEQEARALLGEGGSTSPS